jgi:plasmid maintenance system antidote protein VapI
MDAKKKIAIINLYNARVGLADIVEAAGVDYHTMYTMLSINIPDFKERQKAIHEGAKKFGMIIDEELTLLNKTQSWLAREINESRQVISMYVVGRCVPTKERAKKICHVFDLDYESLHKLDIQFKREYHKKTENAQKSV